MISSFTYNSLGQLLSASDPDEGEAYFKYGKDGQIRFSQNNVQKVYGRFSYTDYDALGRPVESGVANGDYDLLNPDLETPVSTKRERTFTEYDIADKGLEGELLAAGFGEAIYYYNQQFLSGNVSYTWNEEPATNKTWYSYDAYGRVTWMIQKIEGIGLKTIDYEYDFAKGVVTKVIYQKFDSSEVFAHRYSYNVAGELTKVETSKDNINFTEQARYEYFETGELKRTVVAENAQGIDYIYNLNGQLKAINHPSRDKNLDPGYDGNNGVAEDLFGFALDYYIGDYSRTGTPTPVTSTTQGTNRFNGHIKSTRWSTGVLNGGNQSGQLYTYNKNNWLQQADFGSAQSSGNITVGSDYQVSNITYDANGNIQTLNRNKNTDANDNAMDQLTYHYDRFMKNRLTHVEDAVTVTTGADDIKSQSENNYLYNTLGQLEVNKEELFTYQYNASGLVTNISKIINPGGGSGVPNPKPFPLFKDDFNTWIEPLTTDSGAILLFHSYDWTILNSLSDMTHELGTNFSISTGCFLSGEFPMARVTLSNSLLVPTGGGPTPPGIPNPGESAIQKLFDVIESKEHEFNFTLIRKKTDFDDMIGTTLTQYPIKVEVRTKTGTVLATHTVPASTDFSSSCDNEFLKQAVSISYTPPTGINKVYLVLKHEEAFSSSQFMIDNLNHSVLAEPSLDLYYDERGFRIRKEAYVSAYKATTWYIRDASGNVMAIVEEPPGRGPVVINREHPIYGQDRVGMYHRNDDTHLYELKDHLGNVRATLVKSGSGLAAISSATDYYPFGMPMPGRQIVGGEPYRYAYQGQEKDPETGKEAFQLRLWDSRIGRWLTPDPAGEFDSPYLGMGNNPVFFIDKAGDTIKPFRPKDANRVTDLKKRLKKTNESFYNLLENSDVNILISYDNRLRTYAHFGTKFTTYGLTQPLNARSNSLYKLQPNDLLIEPGSNGRNVAGVLNFVYKKMDKRFFNHIVKEKSVITKDLAEEIFNTQINYTFDSILIQFNTGIENTPNVEMKTALHELGHAEFWIYNTFEAFIWDFISRTRYESKGAGHGKYNPNGINARQRERLWNSSN